MKKTLKAFWLALLGVLWFTLAVSSCQKEPKTTFIKVSGRVLEFGSNKPIPNAKVGIYEEGGVLLGSSWTKLLDTTRTNAYGVYQFDKQNLSPKASFFISAFADKYLPFESNGGVVTGREYIGETFVLKPFAWIRFRIKNQNPVDSNDQILFGLGFNAMVARRYGSLDTTYITTCVGNTRTSVTYGVQKSGVWKNYSDTVTVKAHDTLFYQVLY